MPIYELFCLARPQLARAQHAEMFRSTAKTVLDGGGVLTDLKSFGERRLAYRIRNFGGIFSEVRPPSIAFAALQPNERHYTACTYSHPSERKFPNCHARSGPTLSVPCSPTCGRSALQPSLRS